MTQRFDKPMSLSFVMLEVDSKNTEKDNQYSYTNLPELSIPIVDHSYTTSSPMSPSSSSGSSTISNLGPSKYNKIYNKKNNNDMIDDEDEDDENYVTSIINCNTINNNNNELTLLERRQRNKTASAKYRQKKNRQQSEMKKLIDTLTENERLLKRQVKELHLENQQLKSMNDHLRGKIIAKKMLHRYIEKHNKDHHQHHYSNFNPTNSSSATTTTSTALPLSINNCNNKIDDILDKMNHSTFENTTQIFGENFDQDDIGSLDSY